MPTDSVIAANRRSKRMVRISLIYKYLLFESFDYFYSQQSLQEHKINQQQFQRPQLLKENGDTCLLSQTKWLRVYKKDKICQVSIIIGLTYQEIQYCQIFDMTFLIVLYNWFYISDWQMRCQLVLLLLSLNVLSGFCMQENHRRFNHLSYPLKTIHLTEPQAQIHTARNLQTLTRNKLRMTINTIALNTVTGGTTSAVMSFIAKVMQVAKQFLTSRIKVSPQSGNILAPAMCVDYPTSTNDQQSGIAISDLHVYVSYVTDNTLSWTATGKYCKVAAGSTGAPNADPTLARGRPIMGRIKFNTARTLDSTTLTNRLFADTTATTLHELIHIMGFDSSLYNSFLDSTTGKVYTTAVLQTATGLSSGRSVTKMITTPKVVAWAQAWFSCGGITGMLVENQGFDGDTVEWATSTGSHWDRTLMYDQLMTRTAFSAQRGISGLTYSLLMDMGWYTVDDSFNDTSPYGYLKGCDFFFNACNASTAFTEFCDSTQSIKSCTSQNLGKGVCQITPYSDNCGIWVSAVNCVDEQDQGDGTKSSAQQKYGTSSFCIGSTLTTVPSDNNLRSRCYPYVCYNNGTIVFTIGVSMIVCLSSDAGVNKTLAGFSGSLTCPVYLDFCTISRKTCPKWCSQNGFCTRGICNCLSGYSGDDCSVTSCTTSTTFYNPTTKTCAALCPTGTYGNAYSFTCMTCASTCTQCVRQSTICTSCVGGTKVKYETNCYDACPQKTYLSGSECFNCTAPCFNCTGNLVSNCTSCQNSLYLSTSTMGTCGATCTQLSFPMYDTVNYKCVNGCADNLVQTGTSTCGLCPSGQFKVSSNTCTATCPNGQYPDSTRRICGTCHTSCRTCIDVYAQNCTQCWSNSTNKYLYLGQCVLNTTCPLGTYADDSNLRCTYCPAGLNCSSCVNTSTGIVCLKCKYNWYMNSSGKCDIACASNQYKNDGNNSCVNCNAACSSCTSGTNTSCTGCQNSKYLLTNSSGGYCLNSCPVSGYYGDNFQCISCYSSCASCIGSSIDKCLSCKNGMYLANGHCYYACPQGSYKDNTTYKCFTCNETCKFCFGPLSTNCSECINETYSLENTSCVTSCSTGLKRNQWGVCTWGFRKLMQLGIFIWIVLIFE